MKAIAAPYDLPPEKKPLLARAKRLEWASLVLLGSAIAIMGLVMGSSETMKAMWVEDLLSLVPSLSFLIASRFREKDPDKSYPYGYRRAVLVGFMFGAAALCGLGLYVLLESAIKLIQAEHPTIPTVEVFGHTIWLGWIMLAALIYSAIPPFVLGRMKKPLSDELHDKALHVSATVNKGDWLSGLAGAAGIIGLAYGWWWADAAAGAIISIAIVNDGYENLRNSTAQLMNKQPTDIESQEEDPATKRLQAALEQLDWVAKARVRLREDGDILAGDAFIQPKDEMNLLARLEEARAVPASIDWRLHDINMIPVRSID